MPVRLTRIVSQTQMHVNRDVFGMPVNAIKDEFEGSDVIGRFIALIEIAVGFEVFAEFLEGAFLGLFEWCGHVGVEGEPFPLGELNDLLNGEIEIEWDDLGRKVVDQIDFIGETVNVHLES